MMKIKKAPQGTIKSPWSLYMGTFWKFLLMLPPEG